MLIFGGFSIEFRMVIETNVFGDITFYQILSEKALTGTILPYFETEFLKNLS